MLIDTHCHLNHDRFTEDMSQCLDSALRAGVERLIVVGWDLDSSEAAVRLAEENPTCLRAAVGVHPHDAHRWNEPTRRRLAELCENPLVVAVGEIGLDYHYELSPREAQYVAFREQLRLAADVNKPYIIHCREAFAETMALLTEERTPIGRGVMHAAALEIIPALDEERAPAARGVMHCWAGTPEQALLAVEAGLLLGFGGLITYKNAEEVRLSARCVPAASLLLETDSPYLAPVPHRGKRCEPAFMADTAARLAELREVSPEEIAAITTANARRIFGID